MPDTRDVIGGRYELEVELARGGMATVWRGRDTVLARTVALKVLHPHLAEDPAFLERFRREALAAAGLGHPHIVSIYDTGEGSGEGDASHFIVMEHCSGGTLADLLARDGPFGNERAAAVAATICEALAYAHERGIVHRDVKPANVLVGDDGLLKVGDFGIAKAVSEKSDLTTTGSVLGTVAYISPEYASDRELDARSDIYSLGVVLYELVAGLPPFQETSSVATAMKHLNEPPPPPRSQRAGISRSLEAVILKALEKDPEDRFASADEMRRALEPIAGSTASGPVPRAAPPLRASEDPRSGTFRHESRWIAPVLALVVGAFVIAAAISAIVGENEAAAPDDDPQRPAVARIDAVDVSDFDPPPGDGEEHTGGLSLVTDGDPATVWRTDIYQQRLAEYKPGVGILFDLGEGADVARVEVVTPDEDLDVELWAGDEAPTSIDDLEKIGEADGGAGEIRFDTSAGARYWVVWIVDLPGGGPGLASIGEVRFFGS